MFKLNLIFAASNASLGNYWIAGFCLAAAVLAFVMERESKKAD